MNAWIKMCSRYEWQTNTGLYLITGSKGNQHQNGDFGVHFTPNGGKRIFIGEAQFLDYAKRIAHWHFAGELDKMPKL